MKTSKRILGIALAVIMIFNVFAVGVFAMPENTVVDLIIKTDKTAYAPGDTITLTIAAQTCDEVSSISIGGQYEVAYPSSAVTPLGTGGETGEALMGHGFVPLINGFAQGISTVTMPCSKGSDIVVPGTDATVRYNVGDDESYYAPAIDAPVDLFTVQMTVNANAEPGTYTIGFNKTDYENWGSYINDGMGLGGLYGVSGTDFGFSQENMFNFGSVTFTVGAGKIIFHEKAQHKVSATTEEYATLGFVGEFDSTNIGGFTFKEGSNKTLDNVTAVGVELTIEGMGTKEYTTDTVYTKGGTEYNFRAILADLPLDQYGDTTIKARYFITYEKAGASTTEYSEIKEFTANGIIND